jgi:hypothetical protein
LATKGTALTTFLQNIASTQINISGANSFGFNNDNNIYFAGSAKAGGIFEFDNSFFRTYILQDADGTLAFTSDLNAYLPLTGGTVASSGSTNTLNINHTSGSGIALNITKGGNGEGIRVNKTSGSGNAATIIGTLEATTLVKTGGTASQFLKADGSIDSNTYVTTNTTQIITGAKTFNEATLNIAASGASGISQFNNFSSDWGYFPNANRIGFNGSKNFYIANQNGNGGVFTFSNPASVVSYAFPPTSGTIALTSDLGAYLPLTGGTLTGALNGTSATFSSSVTAVQASIGYTTAAPTNGMIVQGDVGIGTTNPANQLEVGGEGVLRIRPSSDGTQGKIYLNDIAGTDSYRSDIGIVNDGGLYFSTTGTINTAPTERMRITSGGFSKHSNNGVYGNAQLNSTFHEFHRNDNGVGLNVFCETSSYTSSVLVLNCTRVTSNGTYSFIEAAHQNVAVVFRVADSGNVTNVNNSYGSISDVKLKENVVDASPKLDDLLKVKVRNYNFIGDDKKQIGVIAQELEQVFPAMIDESEDFEEVEVPQLDEEGNEVVNEKGEVLTTKERVSKGTTTKSVKYSVFVPMLIKAIQELKAEIDILKQK